MFDDLQAYFIENVVGSYLAYRDVRNDGILGRSHDVRAATDCAIALYHFREHVPALNRKSRREIAALCPSYSVLGDIANVSKHRVLTQGTPRLRSAENILELVVVTLYEDEAGQYSHSEKLVLARLLDGTERDVLSIFADVINFWGSELVKQGVLQQFRSQAEPIEAGSVFVTREEARSKDIEMIQGVRFKKRTRILRFDRSTMKSTLVDPTTSRLTLSVYKPATVEAELIHKETGRIIRRVFQLDGEQTREVHSLKSDAERDAFLERIVHEKKSDLEEMIRNSPPQP